MPLASSMSVSRGEKTTPRSRRYTILLARWMWMSKSSSLPRRRVSTMTGTKPAGQVDGSRRVTGNKRPRLSD